jgi:hypothetical protein
VSLCRNVSEIFKVRLEWILLKMSKFCPDFTHKNAVILYDRENINLNRIQYVIKHAGWIYDFSATHVWLFPPNSVPAQLLDSTPSSYVLVQGCPHPSLPFLLYGSIYSGTEKFLHSGIQSYVTCVTAEKVHKVVDCKVRRVTARVESSSSEHWVCSVCSIT